MARRWFRYHFHIFKCQSNRRSYLSIHPIVLAKGILLFRNIQTQLDLKMIKSIYYESGLIQSHYEIKDDTHLKAIWRWQYLNFVAINKIVSFSWVVKDRECASISFCINIALALMWSLTHKSNLTCGHMQ